jgi:ATP-dependent Lhr-like helicase
VAQQAIVLSLERGELPTRELVLLLQGSFPELQVADIEALVEHLLGQHFLDRTDGVVQAGPQTERSYARGHYRDLLASFSGSQLLTGRHGAAEVGFIDPTVLTGERDERLLLLAGRSWRATAVDWSKRIVWLEPAAGGGKARWMGGARSLGRGVCQGIRSVLANGASPTINLSRRAQAALQTLSDEIPMSSVTQFVMSRSDAAPLQTWTFAGTRANRTFARQASIGRAKVRFDALSVQAPIAALTAALPEHLDLTDNELAAFHGSIKFADCLPRQLLSRAVVARNFETPSESRDDEVETRDYADPRGP